MEGMKSRNNEALGISVSSTPKLQQIPSSRKLPLPIEKLLFGEKNIFCVAEVFKELDVVDHTLQLSLKKIVILIMKCKDFVSVDDINTDNERLRIEINRGLATIDILRDDYVWEHLNVGHWKSVPSMWRKTYTLLSLFKVILLLQRGEPYKEVIRQCDLGLLMGEPILRNILSSVAEELSDLIRQNKLPREGAAEFCYEARTNDDVKLANQWNPSKFDISYEINPSLESFLVFMKKEKPVVITGSIEHWPARHKWCVAYIKEVAGFRTVPVEIGPKYTSEEWTQKLMKIDEFIERYMESGTPHEMRDSSDVGYIAQHHLFDQILELKKDIKVPEYCTLGNCKDVEVNAWFGPANTISPTHYDPKHNLLVQVFGTKIVRLYPPSESIFLQPFPSTSLLFNTSQIDVEDPDLHITHPEVKNAKYCEFLLKSGMVLYIPPKWWHYVKSLTPCFSVSFWYN